MPIKFAQRMDIGSACVDIRQSPKTEVHVSIHRLKWRHGRLWSWYDLRVVGHDVMLYEVNWWDLSHYYWPAYT